MSELLHNYAENIHRQLDGKRVGMLYSETPEVARMVHSTRLDFVTVSNVLALNVYDIPYFPEAVDSLEEVIRGINSVDLIYKIVHGKMNRSGLFQGLCITLRKPYAGHDLQTDLVSQNKLIVKRMMHEGNIRTPKYTKISPEEPQKLESFMRRTKVGQFVLKPVETNSSIGILFVESPEELRRMASELPVQYGNYFAEEFVPGRVITLGVIPLQDNGVYVTPALEYIIESDKPIMDHNWKQSPNRVAPTLIPEDVYKKASQWAKYLHRAVNAKGITRSDFIMTPNRELFALEINTNVGLAKTNDVPIAAIAGGESYEDIILANIGTAFLKSNAT